VIQNAVPNCSGALPGTLLKQLPFNVIIKTSFNLFSFHFFKEMLSYLLVIDLDSTCIFKVLMKRQCKLM
jgi:hypothetical protein